MKPSHRAGRPRLLAAVLTATMLALTGLAAAVPAAAHDPGDTSRERSDAKRKEYVEGMGVPLVGTPNVHFVTNLPQVTAISGCFAKSAPYFYTSTLHSIGVYDVRDPLAPKLTGLLPNVVFENEAMNCGEKTVAGAKVRFVLVGIDLTQASTDDIEHIRPVGFDEFLVVDVTDPAHPRIRTRFQTSSSTHTVACVRETECDYAYTAGGSVIDLTNLDAPRELTVLDSPAMAPNPVFTSGAGHKWNFDDAGYGIHTGSGGSAVYDVRDPAAPRLVTTTDANGTAAGWNDFIHHNSDRPNARAFTPGTAPSVQSGNVLLVTEEDYENTDCTTAGSFQTWQVTTLDGTPSAIRPLDRINPVDVGEGVALPHEAFCSAHWFDYHPSGIVAQGYYEGGLRLIDVRDPRNITEYGYFASGLSEVWDAYWVPERNKNGVATGKKTNIVYTADLVRGLDVFTVDLPPADQTSGPLPSLPSAGSAPALGTPPAP